MSEELEAPVEQAKATPLWQTLLKLLVSVALIIVILHMIDLHELGRVFRQANWPLLIGSFAIFAASQVVRAWRWHVLIACHKPGLPFWVSLNALIVSFFFNMFLPAELGGDVVRGLWLDKQVGSRSATFASVLADRMMGMLTMAVIAGGSLAFGAGHISHTSVVMVLVVCVALLAATAVMSSERIANFVIGLRLWPKRFHIADSLHRFTAAIRLYRTQKRAVVWAIVWSFIFQGAIYGSYYYLAQALHTPCPLWAFFAFVPLITIMTMFPASLNGIGAREAGYVVFFHEVGLTATQATSLSLASYAFLVAVSLIGGLVYAAQKRAA
jgi:glycosyltransferase 2 family protein